jgi:hypothetical protein
MYLWFTNADTIQQGGLEKLHTGLWRRTAMCKEPYLSISSGSQIYGLKLINNC